MQQRGVVKNCAGTRDGVPPIELVDGEKLVAMFERAGIGLRPIQTYELDAAFFEEFKA